MKAAIRRHVNVLAIVAVVLLIGGVNLLWTSHEVGRLRAQQHAQCKFDADLGAAPIITQRGLKPSLLGVTIVSDTRIAWHGNDCPGHLPAAAPSFIRWAKRYHLPFQ